MERFSAILCKAYCNLINKTANQTGAQLLESRSRIIGESFLNTYQGKFGKGQNASMALTQSAVNHDMSNLMAFSVSVLMWL
jgi:hypothetical protein